MYKNKLFRLKEKINQFKKIILSKKYHKSPPLLIENKKNNKSVTKFCFLNG